MILKNRFIAFVIIILFANVQMFSQQVVTREHLLKLFYEAKQAQKVNDLKKEEAVYKQILRLSPRLPEPYMRLGEIYKADKNNLKSQKKALLSYSILFKLKVGTSDTLEIARKMEEVQHQVSLLQQSELLAEFKEKGDIKKQKVVIPNVSRRIVTDIQLTQEVKPVEVTLDVSKNTKREAVKEKIIHKDIKNIPISGRWVSAAKGANAREAWILDIQQVKKEVTVTINDRSAIKSTTLFESVPDTVIYGSLNDNKLLIDFTVPGSSKIEEEKGLIGTVSNMLENTLGFDMLDWNLFSETKKKKKDRELLFNYIFDLEVSSNSMEGNIRTVVREKSQPEIVVLDNIQECKMYLAPIGYNGLDVPKLSLKEKQNSIPFKELFASQRDQSENSEEAMNNLGCLYWSGIGTSVNLKKAMKCFVNVALENADAQLNLALMYLNGIGMNKDVDRAREWYLSAAKKGIMDAYVLCGDTYMMGVKDEVNFETALFYYKKAIQAGNAFGNFRLGWLYKEGIGVRKDEKMAMHYLERAVENGYVDAKRELSALYEKQGKMDKSLVLLKEAAAENDAQSMLKLSDYYLNGNYVEQNFIKAKELERSALLENERIMFGYSSLNNKVKDIYKQLMKWGS